MLTPRCRCALALLCLPALLTLAWPDLGGAGQSENRGFQNFPGMPRTRQELDSWPRRFDKFAADHFPGRAALIDRAGALLYRAGVSLSPEVSVERDGWLYLTRIDGVRDKARGILRMTAAETTAWGDVYQRRRARLAARGVRLALAIVPDKSTAYPQRLHPWHRPVGPTLTDQIVGELARRGVPDVLDLRPVFAAASPRAKLYDQLNSHWNDAGALLGYRAILRLFPDATPLRDDEIVFQPWTRAGDLSKLIGSPSLTEQTTRAELPRTRVVARENWARKDRYGEEAWSARTNLPAGPSVLVLCDSYTNTFLYKFLEESFPATTYKHHRGLQLDADELRARQPQAVLYVVAERLLPTALADTPP